MNQSTCWHCIWYTLAQKATTSILFPNPEPDNFSIYTQSTAEYAEYAEYKREREGGEQPASQPASQSRKRYTSIATPGTVWPSIFESKRQSIWTGWFFDRWEACTKEKKERIVYRVHDGGRLLEQAREEKLSAESKGDLVSAFCAVFYHRFWRSRFV